jgi:branched-chain amino acid aminotransferase
VIIATVTRRNEGSPLSRIKSLNYLDNILARIEAEQAGVDDALLRNNRDMIVESTVSNLFAVIDDLLVTPPIADGALPGVIRERVCSLNAVEERSLTVDALSEASEVFLTNSLAVRPVVAINGRAVGDGLLGPVTRRLVDSRLISG